MSWSGHVMGMRFAGVRELERCGRLIVDLKAWNFNHGTSKAADIPDMFRRIVGGTHHLDSLLRQLTCGEHCGGRTNHQPATEHMSNRFMT